MPFPNPITYLNAQTGDINSQIELASYYYKNRELTEASKWISKAINSDKFKYNPEKPAALSYFTVEQLFKLPVIEATTEDAYLTFIFYWRDTYSLNDGDWVYKPSENDYENYLNNLLSLVKRFASQVSNKENCKFNLLILFMELCHFQFANLNEQSPYKNLINEIQQILKKLSLIPSIQKVIEDKLEIYLYEIGTSNDEVNKTWWIRCIKTLANYNERYAGVVINWHNEKNGPFKSTSNELLKIAEVFPKTVLIMEDHSKIFPISGLGILLHYLENPTMLPSRIDLNPIIRVIINNIDLTHAKLFFDWLIKRKKSDGNFSSDESENVLTLLIKYPALYDSHYESILKRITPVDIYKSPQYKELINDNAAEFLDFFKGDKLKNIVLLFENLETYLIAHHTSSLKTEEYIILSTRDFAMLKWGLDFNNLEMEHIIYIFRQTPIEAKEKSEFIEYLYQKVKKSQDILAITQGKSEMAYDILKYGRENNWLDLEKQKDIAKLNPDAAKYFLEELETEKKNGALTQTTYQHWKWILDKSALSIDQTISDKDSELIEFFASKKSQEEPKVIRTSQKEKEEETSEDTRSIVASTTIKI